MREQLQRAWLARGPLARSLWPVSLAYRTAMSWRSAAYRLGLRKVTRVGVPVIVVGNVIAGGAGKTPVVIAIVEHLLARGLRVGVVSRGWGRTSRGVLQVFPDANARQTGDEPLLIQRRTGVGVWVGEQRADAALALLESAPQTQVIVSDDGLQHLALGRDIEICVFDERGTGNGWLLPAGPLRESWPRRCDLVLRDVKRQLAAHAVDMHGQRHPLEALATEFGKPVKALAGIASPERFFSMLAARGVELAATEALPDHYAFETQRPADEHRYTIVCTEKDAVKLWLQRPDALAVPLEVDLDETTWKVLDALVDAKLSSADGHPTA